MIHVHVAVVKNIKIVVVNNYQRMWLYCVHPFFRKEKIYMEDVNIRFLKNSDKDYKLLEKWYQKEEIYSSFEQRKLTFEEIKEKYYPRTFKNAKIPVYIIEYKNIPVGIIQYKLVQDREKELYKLVGDNIYELDIFIGELKFHNKGIGSTAINILSKILYEEKNAKILIMCPLKSNAKAIKCYQKCGFIIKKYFKDKDTIGVMQEYALMIK